MKTYLVKGNLVNPISRLKTEVIHNGAFVVQNGKIKIYCWHP